MKTKMLCALAITLISGCASMGGEDKFSATYVQSHLIPHKTTQAQVQAIYGVPDAQSTYSDGSYYWSYQKNGNLSAASNLVGYIPGAGAVGSALGMANSANQASNAASTAAGKVNGNVENHGDSLRINFGKDKIVSYWGL
ncbi:hypothetical protein ACIQAL_22450 [Pseudomonas sp. NPDC088368]|uniref:hypothetical protein n=1 Tax=Pseudomonas sp. NPDC088368 TaxID=3364453 RepID=UPI003806A163